MNELELLFKRFNGSKSNGTDFDVSAPDGQRIKPISEMPPFTPNQIAWLDRHIEQIVAQAVGYALQKEREERQKRDDDILAMMQQWTNYLENEIRILKEQSTTKVKTINRIPSYEDITSITCQIFHNTNLTKKERQGGKTEYKVKLEIRVPEQHKPIRCYISMHRPLYFFKKKLKAVTGLKDDVREFLLSKNNGPDYHVGMVEDRTNNGTAWVQEQVLTMSFERGRPIIILYTDGMAIPFDDFEKRDGSEGASEWTVTWHKQD